MKKKTISKKRNNLKKYKRRKSILKKKFKSRSKLLKGGIRKKKKYNLKGSADVVHSMPEISPITDRTIVENFLLEKENGSYVFRATNHSHPHYNIFVVSTKKTDKVIHYLMRFDHEGKYIDVKTKKHFPNIESLIRHLNLVHNLSDELIEYFLIFEDAIKKKYIDPIGKVNFRSWFKHGLSENRVEKPNELFKGKLINISVKKGDYILFQPDDSEIRKGFKYYIIIFTDNGDEGIEKKFIINKICLHNEIFIFYPFSQPYSESDFKLTFSRKSTLDLLNNHKKKEFIFKNYGFDEPITCKLEQNLSKSFNNSIQNEATLKSIENEAKLESI